MLAMRAESMRLIWPAPTPMRHAVLAEHDGVGLDVLGDLPGEQQVLQLLLRRLLLRHDLQVASASSWLSAVCISRPEPTRLTSIRLRPLSQAVAPPGGSAICSSARWPCP
jgi:hypothetical protein